MKTLFIKDYVILTFEVLTILNPLKILVVNLLGGNEWFYMVVNTKVI